MTIVFRHARIRTGIAGEPLAQALAAAHDGRVLAVGTEADVRAAAPDADLVDLDGAVVLPGLHDAHIHTAHLARESAQVDLREASSLDDALAQLGAWVAAHPGTAPVLGGRWNHNRWQQALPPDRASLDSVCPDRPVALASIHGHTVAVNSQMLRLTGIDGDTPDPPGGQIVRDAAGEPTGLLLETAGDLVAIDAPQAELEDLLGATQNELLSVGLTSITDIDGEDCRAAYEWLHGTGRLALRVCKSIPQSALEQAIAQGRCSGAGDELLSVGPLKLFSDGALGSHTALMSEPYADDAGNVGMTVLGYDELMTLVLRANAAGIAVATHAIGDRAAGRVLNTYENAPRTSLRHRLEHAQHLRRRDIDRLARLGVIASMQPTHCTADIEVAERALGDRDVISYGWRSLLDAGAMLAFGSDAPVVPADPFHALAAAVSRQRADGSPAGGWQPEQRLTMVQAWHAHTVGAAYAVGQEGDKGTLAPGMLADLIAVDTDPFDAEPQQVWRTQVLTTVVGGQVRWQR